MHSSRQVQGGNIPSNNLSSLNSVPIPNNYQERPLPRQLIESGALGHNVHPHPELFANQVHEPWLHSDSNQQLLVTSTQARHHPTSNSTSPTSSLVSSPYERVSEQNINIESQYQQWPGIDDYSQYGNEIGGPFQGYMHNYAGPYPISNAGELVANTYQQPPGTNDYDPTYYLLGHTPTAPAPDPQQIYPHTIREPTQAYEATPDTHYQHLQQQPTNQLQQQVPPAPPIQAQQQRQTPPQQSDQFLQERIPNRQQRNHQQSNLQQQNPNHQQQNQHHQYQHPNQQPNRQQPDNQLPSHLQYHRQNQQQENTQALDGVISHGGEPQAHQRGVTHLNVSTDQNAKTLQRKEASSSGPYTTNKLNIERIRGGRDSNNVSPGTTAWSRSPVGHTTPVGSDSQEKVKESGSRNKNTPVESTLQDNRDASGTEKLKRPSPHGDPAVRGQPLSPGNQSKKRKRFKRNPGGDSAVGDGESDGESDEDDGYFVGIPDGNRTERRPRPYVPLSSIV